MIVLEAKRDEVSVDGKSEGGFEQRGRFLQPRRVRKYILKSQIVKQKKSSRRQSYVQKIGYNYILREHCGVVKMIKGVVTLPVWSSDTPADNYGMLAHHRKRFKICGSL